MTVVGIMVLNDEEDKVSLQQTLAILDLIDF